MLRWSEKPDALFHYIGITPAVPPFYVMAQLSNVLLIRKLISMIQTLQPGEELPGSALRLLLHNENPKRPATP